MLRFTRPLLQAAVCAPKTTTGFVGLAVHPDPLPALSKTYKSTLSLLESIPESSIYRQGVQALTAKKLAVVEAALEKGDVELVEKELGEGQLEEALLVAQDEFKLVGKMIEWKP
ncbi:hypothetical protein SISSUDRAFT_1029059 [Sistotremastrum suecicum HHB10207 ss-3]|uniref:NADH2 dehydrogenase n=1 Tax=Sistotremastrum suecicum HHB10207 ss-3 TaxID=1314776 RepID=A0A166J3L2_9AGAM|nr:hypothetical protein SISSUDRAFT_1029059 [Sistotremastrum suecicum HHB10207 ss-3]